MMKYTVKNMKTGEHISDHDDMDDAVWELGEVQEEFVNDNLTDDFKATFDAACVLAAETFDIVKEVV